MGKPSTEVEATVVGGFLILQPIKLVKKTKPTNNQKLRESTNL